MTIVIAILWVKNKMAEILHATELLELQKPDSHPLKEFAGGRKSFQTAIPLPTPATVTVGCVGQKGRRGNGALL